jgi:DNA-binding transcriptional ArsR family regulator
MSTDGPADSRRDASTGDDGPIADVRDEYPSGWRVLTQHDSVGRMIDAIMDALPGSEFTKTELAQRAGVSRQSVHSHLDLLLALDVLEPVPETSPQRYRRARESPVLEGLHRLEGAVHDQLNPATE